MSVTADDPYEIPEAVLPRRFGGRGDDGEVFELVEATMTPELSVVPDRPPHYVVSPSENMPLPDFQAALAATRPWWRMWP